MPLTRQALREYDPGAERALRHWIARNGSPPADVQVPTRKEVNDTLIARGEANRSARVAYLLASRHARGMPPPA